MLQNIISWISIGNYRLLFVNLMLAVFCLAWFGNNILFGVVIGAIILIIHLYITFFAIKYICNNFINDIKTRDSATIIYRYLLITVIYIVAIITTIFALYLICTAQEKASLNYMGGSFICFFEVIVLLTTATKIAEVHGNFLDFLSD